MSEGLRIGSLFMELGFDVDQVKLNDIVQTIGKLNLNIVLASLGVAGLVDGLKNIMEVGAGLTEPMYQFGQETSLSAQKMQQWSEYAQSMGVKGDVVSSSLAGLQKKMAAMKFGDASLLSGIYLLQQAGAKINESDLNNPFSFLNKATEGLQKIKPELRTYVAGLLGLNEQVLLLKSFNGAESMPTPTPEQVQSIRDYTSAWTILGINLKQVITDIASDLSPGLQKLGESLNSLTKDLHNNASQLANVVNVYLGLAALFIGGPWGQAIYVLYMIATHLKEVGDAARIAGEWINKLFSSYMNIAKNSDNWINKNFGSIVPNVINSLSQTGLTPVLGASALSTGTNHQVTQHNAITIIAHNIEDIEHKFVTFMEKTIAKSFYQNSSNG